MLSDTTGTAGLGALPMLPNVVRRLPLMNVPEPGESLRSWLLRCSVTASCPPGLMAVDLGLPVRAHWNAGVKAVLFGLVLDSDGRKRVGLASGLTPEAVTRMHLQLFHRTALDLHGLNTADERTLSPVAHREWMLPVASRACPSCLRERPDVWKLWWKLCAAVACPQHRCRLLDRCPRCTLPFTRGSASTPPGLSVSRLHDPLVCGNRVGGQRCGQRLDLLPRTPASPVLIGFQAHLLQIAHLSPEDRVELWGQAVPPAAWFATLVDLSALVRAARSTATAGTLEVHEPEMRGGRALGPPCMTGLTGGSENLDRHLARGSGDSVLTSPADAEAALTSDWARPSGHGGARYRRPPTDAALATALLCAVAPVMTAPTLSAAISLAAPVVARYEMLRRRESHDPLRSRPLTGPAQALMDGCRHPRTGRVVAAATRLPALGDLSSFPVDTMPASPDDAESHAGPGNLEKRLTRRPGLTDHIPQLVPAEQYNRLIVTHLPGTSPTTGRLHAALAASRLASAGTWASSARALGVDAGRGVKVADVVGRRVRDPEAFWANVRTLLAILVGANVAYRDRERRLSTLTELPTDLFAGWCHQAGTVATPARARHAAAFAWAALTSADWRDAPTHQLPWPRAATLESRREGYRRFTTDTAPQLRTAVIDWARAAYLEEATAEVPPPRTRGTREPDRPAGHAGTERAWLTSRSGTFEPSARR